jgi:N-acetylneuraminate lyase
MLRDKGSFHGIMPAIVTPLDAEGRFNPEAFLRLIERFNSAGVDGLYVCGQTGEGWQQPLDQRKEVAQAAVRMSPAGKTVIVHVGAQSLADAVELARHASGIGAHGISSLPPAGSYSFEEIREYYRAVAASSEVPLLIYYFPSLAPSIRTAAQILQLCELPNIAGLKYTDSDLFKLWEIRRTGAVVFNGSDEMLVAGLIMGANGGIGSIYNLVPDQFSSLYRHAVAGRWQEAQAIQNSINELISVILRFPVNPAVKAILKWSGIDCGTCIAPRRSLSATEYGELKDGIAQTILGSNLLSDPVRR